MNKTVRLLQPEIERSRWQILLRHFGVTVVALEGEAQLLAMCRQQRGGLLVADSGALAARPAVYAELSSWVASGGGVVLTGAETSAQFPFVWERFGEYFDPMTINELLLRYLPDYSRSQPRMEITLPGLCLVNDYCHFCEVLSLGPGGAYIKAGIAPPQKDALVRIHVPLLGMRKEMELEGRVVRQVLPHEANNYAQGFGVRFEQLAGEVLADLNTYIRNVICDLDVTQPFNAVFSPTQSGAEAAATLPHGKRMVFSW